MPRRMWNGGKETCKECVRTSSWRTSSIIKLHLFFKAIEKGRGTERKQIRIIVELPKTVCFVQKDVVYKSLFNSIGMLKYIKLFVL
mmetsp:Transcript_3365/g.3929  ORF Transcript_3365/g.3929 Transcript_3365/m.3929 type:complete len:86 (-) Transcript_3365:49-306(-)